MKQIKLWMTAAILAVVASRRYKEQMVDPEKEELINRLSKLQELNHRLTKRNHDLAGKYRDLQKQMESKS